MYAIILSEDNFQNIKTIRAWEEELVLKFEDDYWNRVLDNVRTTTSCARFSFIQFKTIHSAPLSKEKLSKMYPNVSDECEINVNSHHVILVICLYSVPSCKILELFL